MKSPYLKNDSRLADIIGAVQVMGIYPWASRKAEDWLKSLGEPLSANDWPTIFKEHPEFFRFTKGGWVSLRWRHGYFRTFDPKLGHELSESQRSVLTPAQQEELTHKPLTADQTEALMKTALDFHARAIAHDKDNERYVRWQDYRIGLFSFAINLFLSFAVAALGFYLTLIKDSGFNPPIGSGYLLRQSLFSLIASIFFGGFATCSRLLDFRCTVLKIGKKYSDCRHNIAIFLAEQLGGISYALFCLQLAALAYGAFCLFSTLFATYPDKFSQ